MEQNLRFLPLLLNPRLDTVHRVSGLVTISRIHAASGEGVSVKESVCN